MRSPAKLASLGPKVRAEKEGRRKSRQTFESSNFAADHRVYSPTGDRVLQLAQGGRSEMPAEEKATRNHGIFVSRQHRDKSC